MKLVKYYFILILVSNYALSNLQNNPNKLNHLDKISSLLTRKLKNDRSNDSSKTYAQYYLLDENEPLIILEIPDALQKKMKNFAEESSQNIYYPIYDINFDVVRQKQNLVLNILNALSTYSYNMQDFYDDITNINILIECINLAIYLFPLSNYLTEGFKELHEKLLTLLKSLKQLMSEFESTQNSIILCKFLFRKDEDNKKDESNNNIINIVEKLDHSEIVKENEVNYIIMQYFKTMNELLPWNKYDSLLSNILSKARSKTNLFPSHLLFVIFSCLRNHLEEQYKKLHECKIQFNSTISSYSPKIKELNIPDDFPKETRQYISRLIKYFNDTFSKQQTYEKLINNNVDNIILKIKDIVNILGVFSNYNSDPKILIEVEKKKDENIN